MDKEVNGHLYIANDNLKRIADALEEILRLVKQDMEKYEKKKMTKKITIHWGTDKDPQDKKSYEFKTDEQLKYFMMGVDEANGWLEYEIEEN
jgi:hypothetical protein